jgi:hypothetical protein
MEFYFVIKKALAWLSIAENHLWKNVAITRYKYAYKFRTYKYFSNQFYKKQVNKNLRYCFTKRITAISLLCINQVPAFAEHVSGRGVYLQHQCLTDEIDEGDSRTP